MVTGSEMGIYPKPRECSPIRAHSDVLPEHLREKCPLPTEHKPGMIQIWSSQPPSLEEILSENIVDKVEMENGERSLPNDVA